MKKLMVLLLAALVLPFSVHAEKKTNLVKIQGGQTFNDLSKGVTQSLSEENAGEGNSASLKVTWESDQAGCGVYNPLLKDWSAASSIVIKVFYPGKAISELNLVVVPKDFKGKSRYEARSDSKYILKPGQNTIKIPLGDLVSNGGQPLDLKQIVHFYFAPDVKALAADKQFTIFFQELYLVSE